MFGGVWIYALFSLVEVGYEYRECYVVLLLSVVKGKKGGGRVMPT